MTNSSEPTDDELVDVCRRELPYRSRAFEALVRRHEPRVFAVALSYLGSQADAEDVAQQVFIRVFRALPSFEGRSQFTTWLYRITQNACASRYEQLRRTRRRRERFRASQPETEVDPRADLDARLSGNPAVSAALASLSASDQEILLLRFAAGMELAEIESALGLSESAAKMRLKRARDRFAEAFKAEPDPDQV